MKHLAGLYQEGEILRNIVQLVGVSGFIGSHLFDELADFSVPVVGTSRCYVKFSNIPSRELSNFNHLRTEIDAELCIAKGAEVLVFCAGLAHVQSPSSEQTGGFVEVNCELPVRYAKAAIESGVQRFIYLSSIGVHGDGSAEPFIESSGFAPSDEYSRSKFLAEERLTQLFESTDSELVIIRPPMVYGPAAPGNFSRLSSLVKQGVPLPFGSLSNQRSFIFIRNLVSFLVCCVNHPAAGGQVFDISDDDDTTTRDFVKEIASALGRKVRLIPVPGWLFVLGMTLVGQGKAARKLRAPLTVDCSHARQTLGWTPPYSLKEGVALSLES